MRKTFLTFMLMLSVPAFADQKSKVICAKNEDALNQSIATEETARGYTNVSQPAALVAPETASNFAIVKICVTVTKP